MDGMDMDLVCPWCGADLGIQDLIEYDDAQADHALTQCIVWQKEQGYIAPDATEPITVIP